MRNLIDKPKQTLFWKIFALVWLTNLVIIGATMVVFVLSLEKEKQQAKFERYLERNILPIVLRYEDNGRVPKAKQKLTQFLDVYEVAKSKVVYGRIPQAQMANIAEYKLDTGSGREFLIRYVPVPLNREIIKTLSRQFSNDRLIISLVVISLFSFIITGLVAQPIKRLKKHISLLADGDLDARVSSTLTKRKDEIGQLATTINFMSDKIANLINDKQQLLYDVSHELKAPLARMQVANAISAQIAEQAGMSTKNQIRIDKDIVHLTNMIDELLSLARMEHGDEIKKKEKHDLKQLAAEEINAYQYTWPHRNIKLLGDEGSTQIDKQLFIITLTNLMNNALKHTESDITIEIREQETQWQLKVMDEGSGIPETLIKDLFKPFKRGETNSQGFGLGLAIVQKAVARLEGDVLAYNLPSKGLCVQVNLPKV
ncbi:hypothetical protein C2869_11525 [Saccharobesus litoralis]|uniref:histidine kinase n=1 Tax=Saccharobesus litoralis TaxID=2172099 RepID=A0A2S0VSE9_9ALTE|nr:HAMP domain-containing sensor histidine kinase [Saccharobesus litoralis]AWB67030.1 hypothetical protein C2869_11525 [Saccharobesus litoralis]